VKTIPTLGEILQARGVSRRGFMKYCAATASLLALPPAMVPRIANALEQARRPSVIWLSFQECTGCTESLTRSSSPTLEGLIFDSISLDYHHTLQAASGEAAEAARHAAMQENMGQYLVLVDGSIPMGNPGYSTIAGISNYDMLMETVEGAAAVVAIGSCAAFGGIPGANPNPTGAVSVSDLVKDKPIVNVPGCPPIPMVITAVRADHPRPLLPAAVLRTGQVRGDFRRRGCAQRLVPVQAGLQGTNHL
jgi:hydrogenase small subunit